MKERERDKLKGKEVKNEKVRMKEREIERERDRERKSVRIFLKPLKIKFSSQNSQNKSFPTSCNNQVYCHSRRHLLNWNFSYASGLFFLFFIFLNIVRHIAHNKNFNFDFYKVLLRLMDDPLKTKLNVLPFFFSKTKFNSHSLHTLFAILASSFHEGIN